jgi:glycosyltransferase involved in cell wall biosynthesis
MVEQVLKEDGTPYKVAILIPTINNADELDIVLNRLTQQTYPGIEIVISDSKSRDHTKDVCEKYGATWIEDPSTNRADACNLHFDRWTMTSYYSRMMIQYHHSTGLRNLSVGSKIPKLVQLEVQTLLPMMTHLGQNVLMLHSVQSS